MTRPSSLSNENTNEPLLTAVQVGIDGRAMVYCFCAIFQICGFYGSGSRPMTARSGEFPQTAALH